MMIRAGISARQWVLSGMAATRTAAAAAVWIRCRKSVKKAEPGGTATLMQEGRECRTCAAFLIVVLRSSSPRLVHPSHSALCGGQPYIAFAMIASDTVFSSRGHPPGCAKQLRTSARVSKRLGARISSQMRCLFGQAGPND
jgi:hypothetical protein